MCGLRGRIRRSYANSRCRTRLQHKIRIKTTLTQQITIFARSALQEQTKQAWQNTVTDEQTVKRHIDEKVNMDISDYPLTIRVFLGYCCVSHWVLTVAGIQLPMTVYASTYKNCNHLSFQNLTNKIIPTWSTTCFLIWKTACEHFHFGLDGMKYEKAIQQIDY